MAFRKIRPLDVRIKELERKVEDMKDIQEMRRLQEEIKRKLKRKRKKR